jgi:hypothetical protein
MHGRTADALGFAVSPAVENRKIALEVDQARQRELRRWLVVFVLLMAAACFDGWQRFGIVSHGYNLGEVQRARADEEAKARHLRLTIEALREPGRIELLATRDLRLVSPGLGETRIIERIVPPEQPPSSVVASR